MRKQLSSLVSPRIKGYIRILLGWPERNASRVIKRAPFLASIYYGVFSGRFRREHRAVSEGKAIFLNKLDSNLFHSSFLRRSVHRLEKGLVMKPRRAVFGEQFIVPLVKQLELGTRQGGIDAGEKKWAEDVLQSYFTSVSHTPAVRSAKKAFDSLALSPYEDGGGAFSPYSASARPELKVSYEDLYDLAKRRRSVRWFQPQEVSKDLVEAAIAVASQSPSACNRQPFSVFAAMQPGLAGQVAACAGGTAGWASNIPCTLVLVGDLSAYRWERDRHLIYTDSALFSMSLMFALETLGLATCCINWPDEEHAERKLAKLIGLSTHQRPVMLMAVGYASDDGGVPFSQKKSAHTLIKWIASDE